MRSVNGPEVRMSLPWLDSGPCGAGEPARMPLDSLMGAK